MKKANTLLIVGILFLSLNIILSGCKKKSEDTPIVPSFTVSAITVQLVGGGEGLQFTALCTNDDVKMTKVIVTSPTTVATTYNVNGEYFVKNQAFGLQAADEGYVKALGTWTFAFVGNRTSDNTSFSVGANLSVTGK
jgi:hypothetical protein